jgi:DNA-binding SARP family transcriptional activator
MIRIGRILKGISALALLVALVVGIPWALWHFIGWPLPHHLPTGGQLGRALNQQGIPDQTLIDALAVVVWVTWAVLLASIAVEIPAALGGRHAPRLPFAGIFQPITGRLVAVVIVAVLTLAPRPGHAATSASLGSGLSNASGRQPVAALIVKDAALRDTVLADASRPLTPTTAPAATPANTSRNGAAPASASRIYVVQRGDTLWGIAEQQLGDPLRWSEIYQLNEGRPQPGGATLTDPHWIDPDWTLVLPVGATPVAPPTPAPTPLPAATTPTSPITSSIPPVTPTTTTPPTTAAAPSDPHPATSLPTTRGHSSSSSTAHRAGTTAAPVRLPSGSVVAGSFAAGVLSAVALGRLRRRHAYRYRAPEPGRDLNPEPPRPTLRHLMKRLAADDDSGDDGNDIDVIPVFPLDDTERRQHPGGVDIGTQNGMAVTIEVTDFSGIALVGSATDDIVRALLAALLVRAGPGAAEVVLTADLFDRLLPGLGTVPAIRGVQGIDDVARIVEIETIARTRRLDAAEASDASIFRAENPENPLPLLVVFVETLPDDSLGRWIALLEGGVRLGIAVLFLGASPVASGRLVTDDSRKVIDVDHSDLCDRLMDTVLFGLRGGEAVELLGAVADSHREGLPDDETQIDAVGSPESESESVNLLLRPGGQVEEASAQASSADERWPDEHLDSDGSVRPLVVRTFGTYGITAHGKPVTTGLRNRAKALLAWYLIRPEGASIDEAVEALWPDTSSGQAHKPFWRALGELRTRLRGVDVEALDVLTKTGERYGLTGTEITCDLWEFQSALGAAASADHDEGCGQALRRAVDTYTGDFLQGWDEPWIEVARQDLHRRCLDAHLRLAEIEDHGGDPERAVTTLEGAIDLDHYAEEPYRRIMTLQAAHGHPDGVRATWKLLQSRLDDLDLDVEDATTRLYRSLTRAGAELLDVPHPISVTT